jgi:hypothetical protein
MKSTLRILPVLAISTIALPAVLCLTAYDRFSPSWKAPNMTILSPRLQSLFRKTKTVCFSHFVVEVPATATVVYGPAAVDAPIEYYPKEADKLAEHVASALVKVEANRKYLDAGDNLKFPMYGKTIEGVVLGQKLVFGSKDQATYSIDSFIPVGEDLFVQRRNVVIDKDDGIRSLNAVASNLRGRAEAEVPAEPGTCIDGGFVAWQPEFEKVTVGIRFVEFPDVHFSIGVLKNQAYLVESSSLESRLEGAVKDGGEWYSRITFFRRGPRKLGEWNGSEALALIPAQENVKESHEFHFISLGAVNTPLQPELDIQLDTGSDGHRKGMVKPSLTNEEAVALWDKVTNSIRVRPVGEKRSSATDLPKTPPASLISTGGTCPQTGWWQCTEGDNIEGGRRRHFMEGELLPHAILQGKPNLWQRLTGARPRHRAATVWRLVENSSEPALPSSVPDESSPLADVVPVPPLLEADPTKVASPRMT